MGDGTVGPVEDEVVGHVRRTDGKICLGIDFPLVVVQGVAVPSDRLEGRDEADVETGRGDDQVELLLAVAGQDAFLGDLVDGTGAVACVGLLKSAEVSISRGQATAANLPVGDELGSQLRVVVETLQHPLHGRVVQVLLLW